MKRKGRNILLPLSVKTFFFFLIAGVLLHTGTGLYGEIPGIKFYKNYSYSEYDHTPQNWQILQAPNGMIYVANNGGVLEYDGNNWRVIGVPDYAEVRSICLDQKGTIYVGGRNTFGYLTPGPLGALKYKDLLDKIPSSAKNFGVVWGALAIGENIFFDTSKYLFRWAPGTGKMKIFRHDYMSFFQCNGRLYAQSEKRGLHRIYFTANDEIKEQHIPGGDRFTGVRLKQLIPFQNNKVLIVTSMDGLFLMDEKKSIPFPTEADDFLKKNEVLSGTITPWNDIALATKYGGLIIISSSGKRKYIMNKSRGLRVNTVRHIFPDRDGNLWLSLNNGISKIEFSSPFSFYDERFGISGIILSIKRHEKRLYVGTTNGVFSQSPAGNFTRIQNISGYADSLEKWGDTLLAGTSYGVFAIRGNNAEKILNERTKVLLRSSKRPDRLWCCTSGALVLLTRKGEVIEKDRQFKPVYLNIRFLEEDADGNLWAFSYSGKLLKLEINNIKTSPVITEYGQGQGLPKGQVRLGKVDEKTIFATEKGLYRFNYVNNRFYPEIRFGSTFAGGENGKDVFRIVQGHNKNIWIHSKAKNYMLEYERDGNYRLILKPFNRLSLIQSNVIYPDFEDNSVWFGRFDDLIRFDLRVDKKYETDYKSFIRSIRVNDRTIIKDETIPQTDLMKIIPPQNFNHTERNFQFYFVAPYYEDEARNQYQYILEGYEEHWQDWNNVNTAKYTNLDPGSYTFRIRAKNVFQHYSQEDRYHFVINAPWYRLWWAYILYGAGVLLLSFFLIKLRIRKLEHDKQKLERTITERTKEVSEKNQQLENQTTQLREQSEKLKEMDRVKSRFFANISHEFRTPLTLIMSPIERMIERTKEAETKKELGLILKNSQRVLGLINQLLNLARFDSGKMRLKAASLDIVSFLDGITASFFLLARENRLDIRFVSQEKSIPLYFDPQKLEDAIYNLIFNAFKFTPSGGSITLSVDIETGRKFIIISVKDTGVGIPANQLKYIFDRFYQNDALEKNNKGTGIGLALTREIVKLHHGRIDVFSRENSGTEFTIRLPLGHTHLSTEEIVPAPADPYKFKASGETGKIRFQPKETGTPEQKQAPDQETDNDTESQFQERVPDRKTVLVVEDHREMRTHIRSILEPAFAVEDAADGEEGVTRAKELIPDLIVSDIMMPGKDGFQLTREIKTDIKTSHIPVILLTAKAAEEDVIDGLETGADDYITKPFNSKILLSRIHNLIELRRQMQLKIQREKMLLPSKISATSADDLFLKQFQDTIEQNLDDQEFSIEVICEKLNMGRSTLFKKIHALTGETPNQFIQSYRLERGAQLLKSNFGNVTQVAMTVGFSSSSYFSKCFKEKYHQSPSSFQSSRTDS